MIYVDESGIDERNVFDYGYAPAGQRCHDLKSGTRGQRINMIAGYRGSGLIAPFIVAGGCNRTVFETWIKTCLVPEFEPGDWTILDNATFHHGGQIAGLIENCWAWLKARIRQRLPHAQGL